MICKKCGSSMSEDSLFCSSCGERVTPAASVPPSFGGFFTAAGNLDGSTDEHKVSASPTETAEKHGATVMYSSAPPANGRTARERGVGAEGGAVLYGAPKAPDASSTSRTGPAVAAGKHCPKCGEEITEGSRFCGVCGEPLQRRNTISGILSKPAAPRQIKKPLIIGGGVCVLLVLVVIILVFAGGAGSSGVPDQLVQYTVEDRFKEYENYSVSHDVDNSTHIDTVTVEVSVKSEYCREYYICTAKYQYNKSNDTWSSFEAPRWDRDRTEYIAYEYIGDWEGAFKVGGTFSASITSVDFDNQTITGSFTAHKSGITLGGSRIDYDLDASGTYGIYEEVDGYELKITQDGYTFVFQLSKYYGVLGITIYDASSGYGV